MKRNFSLFLALLLCLSLFACGKQPEAPPVDDPPAVETPPAVEPAPQPETPPVEEPVPVDPLPGELPAPEIPEIMLTTATASYLTETGSATLLQTTTVLPSCPALPLIDSYYRTMEDDLAAIYRLNVEDAAIRYQDNSASGLAFTPFAVEITSTVTRNDGVTLSVLREVYENFGGAYPLITYQADTFDTASQGRLVLGNLFSVSEDEYLARLQSMILVQMDQKESESGVLYYDFAREQLMSLLDPMDFALTEDCLLIFYNEYALAPHAAGLQHFYLPLEQLSDILKPQYLGE